MPLQATSGAASYDAFGGGVAAVPQYIEDVFSTWLYTGNGSTQTITNGIDLAGKGGMVWIKGRNTSEQHNLFDTVRGVNNTFQTEGTGVSGNIAPYGVTAFGNSSFTVTDYPSGGYGINGTGQSVVSWTFRKQPKFFDVVTWTGSGANRTIAHNLGSVPGMIIVKRTDASADWQVYHRSLANTEYMVLNSTAAKATGATRWNSTTPTSTVFSLGTDATVNASGGTYVAYIYAHDAGGFGLTGTDNVITCGTFTTDGSGNASVALGYEPQWVMIKRSDNSSSWNIIDNMRAWNVGGTDNYLWAQGSNSEFSFDIGNPTATGFFTTANAASGSYIYIAIRRGPMKVPTTGTSVFTPVFSTNNAPWFKTNFPTDMGLVLVTSGTSSKWFSDRLRGQFLSEPYSTSAEVSESQQKFDYQNGWHSGSTANASYMSLCFRRAPGFMDVVCYTGTGSTGTVAHNLAAVPELMILKSRSTTRNWVVYPNSPSQYLYINAADPSNAADANWWNSTAPTSSVFSIGAGFQGNETGASYVAYLFATCPNVSKVGSYTGNGTTQAIACGFTGGARFVLIKQTSGDGGDWYVYDTARGMTVMTDPYLLLNSTAAETATLGSVITSTGGFTVNAAILAAINTNAATYIFLAIA